MSAYTICNIHVGDHLIPRGTYVKFVHGVGREQAAFELPLGLACSIGAHQVTIPRAAVKR